MPGRRLAHLDREADCFDDLRRDIGARHNLVVGRLLPAGDMLIPVTPDIDVGESGNVERRQSARTRKGNEDRMVNLTG